MGRLDFNIQVHFIVRYLDYCINHLLKIIIVGTQYTLVSEEAMCVEGKRYQGKLSKENCAQKCRSLASALFVVSRQSTNYCEEDACLCYCFPGKYQDGICEKQISRNDDLYTIKNGKLLSIFWSVFRFMIDCCIDWNNCVKSTLSINMI